jgi:histidinol-phosphate aminotransferase
VVVIDEAYVDFGGESAVKLIDKYENLLVVQTFSKSRSLAGGRLGFAIGSRALIQDLNTIRFSTNPYNINRMTMAAGVGALEDVTYFRNNCAAIEANRAWTVETLESLGFSVLPSKANFVFATHPKLDGGWLYRSLKARGVLVRHFDKPRLDQHVRITIGSQEQMEALVQTVKKIMEESL